MKKLERGKIYRIRYSNYRQDPFPLILVLYTDKTKCHALNINYLSQRLTNQLINVISDVATKKVNGSNAYSFYHRHLKKVIPTVIKYCYRTYFNEKIVNPRLVSEGFGQTRNFLQAIKSRFNEPDYKEVKTSIKKAIQQANDPELEKKRVKRMFRMFRENEKLSPKQLEERVNLYLEHINDIKIKNPKIDWSEFTFSK